MHKATIIKEYGTPIPETQRVDAVIELSQNEIARILEQHCIDKQTRYEGTFAGQTSFHFTTYGGEALLSATVKIWKENK